MSILTNEKDFLNKIKDQEDNIVALNRLKIQDAEIGTAQIGSLSADKITTGTLDVDTRIVVNDGTNDRVIIGKIS